MEVLDGWKVNQEKAHRSQFLIQLVSQRRRHFFNFRLSDGFVNNNIILNTNDEDHARTGIAGSCTVTFNGSQYILGGYLTNYVSYYFNM